MTAASVLFPVGGRPNTCWQPSRARPGLIVTRTPLRISFAGGGTDLAVFYEKEPGAVLSTSIDKFVYVTLKRHDRLFGSPIRLNYSETEQVSTVGEIRNDIARECLKFLEIGPPIYISTVADVPAASGLGSSSAFAVGLLHALHLYRGEHVSAGQLAEEAAHVEIEILGHPIGKQDHYAVAFGGFNFYRFSSGGAVAVESQRCGAEVLEGLFSHLLLFWTGISRNACTVLSEQVEASGRRMPELRKIRDCALEWHDRIPREFEPESFGRMLGDSWRLKRQLASQMSSRRIDAWYDAAMEAGAYGGKICGAGGGGFLLFIVPPSKQGAVRLALGDLLEVPIAYEPLGSRVLMPNVE